MSSDEVNQLKELGYTAVRDVDDRSPARVFLAVHHRRLSSAEERFADELCVIKRIKDMNESEVMKILNHRNVVKTLDTLEVDHLYYLVMEYVKSELTLGQFLTEFVSEELDEFSALLVIKHITLGLQYIHNQDITHHDLHLSNIMVDLVDRQMVCKIIDFGLSARKHEVKYFDPSVDFMPFIGVVERVLRYVNRENLATKKIKRVLKSINTMGMCEEVEGENIQRLNTMNEIAANLLPLLPQTDDPRSGSVAEAFVKEFD